MSKLVRMGCQVGNRMVQLVGGLALAVGLVACGGGGGSTGAPILGGGNGGTGTPATVADLSVVLDKASITNTGSETVTVSVTSVDANRAAVGNAPLTFSVDNGAVITPGGSKTGTTGTLTAAVNIGADRSNRTINVTVMSGSISKKVSFNVVDSVSGGKVADLALTLDRGAMPNDGSQNITLTITSLDASRTAVGGSPISLKITDTGDAFATTNGATSTDATTGQLQATIKLGSNRTNRSVSVTAASGTVSRTISFDVVDSLVTLPKANDISMLLDKTNVGNSGSDVVTVTVTAVDAARNVIAGIPVTFSSSDQWATIQVASQLTNAQGQVTAAVKIGDNRSNRLVTVIAKSESLQKTATFQITGAKVQGTAVPTQPAAGTPGKVDFRLSDVNQNAMIGVDYKVEAPGIAASPVTGKTDANGAFTFSYTAPAAPGAFVISATAGGDTLPVTITVPTPGAGVKDAEGLVSSPTLSASPSVVRSNTSGTTNRSELRALFLDAKNAPVPRVRVRFDMNDDVNSIGGELSSGNLVVYSDESGAAVASYSPGSRSSPTDGVTIRACWGYRDAELANNACPRSVLTSLTVVSDPLSITIGTNEVLNDGPSGLTYVKKYVLLVVDAAGNPKSDVQITPSLDLTNYVKGRYYWDATLTEWVQHFIDASNTAVPGLGPVCPNEDIGRNGVIDVSEDRNGNGQLDPRKSDVSISMVGGTKTDASGSAILQIEYPKSVAGWVQFKITASAAGVLSPPAFYSGTLPVSAAGVKAETPPPAFRISPYGTRSYTNANGTAVPPGCGVPPGVVNPPVTPPDKL